MAQNTSKMGRPSVETEALTIRLPKAMIEKIDRLRGQEPNPPTRQMFIRRHLAEWLEIDE